MTTSFGKPSSLENFIQTFLKLDKDRNGVVDRKELLEYCRKEGIDAKDSSEFMERFDFDRDNKVTFEEFCRGLGLNKEEMTNTQSRLMRIQREGKPQLPEKVQIVSTTMDDYKFVEIAQRFKNLMDRAGSNPDMTKLLSEFKNQLDETYGRVWQVVLLTGSYAMSFCHEPFQSAQFKYGDYICLAWKTPSG